MSSPATSPSSPARSARTPRVPTVDTPRIAPWFVLLLALGAAAATLLLFADYQQSVEPPQVTVSDGDQTRVMPEAEPGPLTLLLGAGAVLTFLLGPLVAMLLSVWAATWAFLSWPELRHRDKVVLLVAALVAGLLSAFDLSVWGEISRTWLD